MELIFKRIRMELELEKHFADQMGMLFNELSAFPEI